jgi:dTDP-4-dehydrorhamnose 3,5-epimerase
MSIDFVEAGLETMKISSSEIFPEVKIITCRRFGDDRGYFCETFRKSGFDMFPEFVQENHSHSKPGVFRGLHYQLNPKAQGKLVSCVSGCIEDFVVDIRINSKTYGKWQSFTLIAASETKMIYVPVGFAHGFYAVEEADVIYRVTDYYSPQHERSIRYNDPDIGINYGFGEIILSDKDATAPLLKDAENNF